MDVAPTRAGFSPLLTQDTPSVVTSAKLSRVIHKQVHTVVDMVALLPKSVSPSSVHRLNTQLKVVQLRALEKDRNCCRSMHLCSCGSVRLQRSRVSP